MNRIGLSRLGLFAFLLMVLLTSCRTAEPSANAQAQPKAVPVKVEPIRSGNVDDRTEYTASLESRKSVELQPRVDGQVIQIFVTEGDVVKAGTPLMQIDARKQRAAYRSKATEVEAAQTTIAATRANAERARATLETAKAELANLQADRKAKVSDLTFNRIQFDRYKVLQTDGAVSKQVLDQYGNSLQAAAANLSALDARIRAQQADIRAQSAEVVAKQAEISHAQKSIQQAQADSQEQAEQLDYYTIKAPFDGTIGNIPVKEGDFVNTGSRLATLTQNNQLQVNVQIPIEHAPQLRIGTQIDLLSDQDTVLGSSRIFFISPKISNDTQSVLVKALVNNGSGKLRADQYIKARVVWDQRPGVFVPTTAISRIAGQNFVYVAEAGANGLVAKQKPVTLGAIRGNDYQVLNGLKPGEKIVTTGLFKLQDGAAIVEEAATPNAPNNSAIQS